MCFVYYTDVFKAHIYFKESDVYHHWIILATYPTGKDRLVRPHSSPQEHEAKKFAKVQRAVLVLQTHIVHVHVDTCIYLSMHSSNLIFTSTHITFGSCEYTMSTCLQMFSRALRLMKPDSARLASTAVNSSMPVEEFKSQRMTKYCGCLPSLIGTLYDIERDCSWPVWMKESESQGKRVSVPASSRSHMLNRRSNTANASHKRDKRVESLGCAR